MGFTRFFKRNDCDIASICKITEPDELWIRSWELMSEDIIWHHSRIGNLEINDVTETEIKSNTLKEIEKIMNINNRSLKDFSLTPIPRNFLEANVENTLITKEEN